MEGRRDHDQQPGALRVVPAGEPERQAQELLLGQHREQRGRLRRQRRRLARAGVVMPLPSLSPLSPLSRLSSLLPPLLSPHMPPPISSRAGGLWHPAARVRRRPLPARQPPRRRPDRPGGRLQLDDPDGVGRRRRRRRDRLRRALPVQHHHERRAPWVVMSLPHSGASPPCAGTTSPRATCASAPTRPSTRRRRARRRG